MLYGRRTAEVCGMVLIGEAAIVRHVYGFAWTENASRARMLATAAAMVFLTLNWYALSRIVVQHVSHKTQYFGKQILFCSKIWSQNAL